MHVWLWIGFAVLIAAILFVDLGVLHRHSGRMTPGKALINTAFFVLLALAFSVVVFFAYENQWMGEGKLTRTGTPLDGTVAVTQYITVWLLEYSLSVDNLFVFTLIFAHFAVPNQHQHRVLFWGILGALLLRGLMIGAGSALVDAFNWVLYIFGVILIITAIKMLMPGEEKFAPEKSWMVRLARWGFPISPKLHGEHFFVREPVQRAFGVPGADSTTNSATSLGGGTTSPVAAADQAQKLVLHATPLLLVLLVVEATDVIFAVDSIPAAFGQSSEPFIIFTSNVFAVMGLRSLYFALAGLMAAFKYLKVSLAVILIFVGIKMLIEHPIEDIKLFGYHIAHVGFKGIPIEAAVSLGVILAALTTGVIASVISRRNTPPSLPAPVDGSECPPAAKSLFQKPPP